MYKLLNHINTWESWVEKGVGKGARAWVRRKCEFKWGWEEYGQFGFGGLLGDGIRVDSLNGSKFVIKSFFLEWKIYVWNGWVDGGIWYGKLSYDRVERSDGKRNIQIIFCNLFYYIYIVLKYDKDFVL